jgi:hypothetical protein
VAHRASTLKKERNGRPEGTGETKSHETETEDSAQAYEGQACRKAERRQEAVGRLGKNGDGVRSGPAGVLKTSALPHPAPRPRRGPADVGSLDVTSAVHDRTPWGAQTQSRAEFVRFAGRVNKGTNPTRRNIGSSYRSSTISSSLNSSERKRNTPSAAERVDART